MNDTLKVSLITTLKNEESSIEEFLDSILNQSRIPDEIIIVDGGSTDKTVEIIKRYIKNSAPIKLIIAKGNRSIGRNTAIKNAQHEIIACTDAGCIIDRDWLKNIVKPFEEDESVEVVAGFYQATPKNIWEECAGVLHTAPLEKINPKTFLASTRSVAFKKSAWRKVGGFPEQYSWNEDTPFNLYLKRAGRKYAFAPDAVVYWRPMPDLKTFLKQSYRFTLGDGQAGIPPWKYLKVLLKYLVGLALLILGLLVDNRFLLLLAILLTLFIVKIINKGYQRGLQKEACLLLPLVEISMNLVVLIGYIIGLIDRIKNQKFREVKDYTH